MNASSRRHSALPQAQAAALAAPEANPKPYRTECIGLATHHARLRPAGARKTFDAAVDQWTAFGSAVLDPIETSSTLGRLLFATGQTGVLTADRTAIATGAKLKTD